MPGHHGRDKDGEQDLYIDLEIDRLRLLLPQRDVHILEPAADIRPVGEYTDHFGTIEVDGDPYPVYCLSSGLQLMTEPPMHWRICVLLQHPHQVFGLVCASVRFHHRTSLIEHTLPFCMRLGKSPITALALCGDEVMSISSVGRLGVCLGLGARLPIDTSAPTEIGQLTTQIL